MPLFFGHFWRCSGRRKRRLAWPSACHVTKAGNASFSFSPRARQRVPLRKPTPLDELICTCTCTRTVGSDQTRGRDVIQPRAVVPSAALPAGCAGHRTPPTAPRAGGPGPHTRTPDPTVKAMPHHRAAAVGPPTRGASGRREGTARVRHRGQGRPCGRAQGNGRGEASRKILFDVLVVGVGVVREKNNVGCLVAGG